MARPRHTTGTHVNGFAEAAAGDVSNPFSVYSRDYGTAWASGSCSRAGNNTPGCSGARGPGRTRRCGARHDPSLRVQPHTGR